MQTPDVSLPGRARRRNARRLQVPDLDIAECVRAIRRENRTFDIALIDPFHEYGTSWRDLDEGFKLIGPGGTLVVHDCLPPHRELVSPTFTPGAWCYAAYIDFVSDRDDLAFYTVDTDYGCGVIKKRGGGPLRGLGDSFKRIWSRIADGEADADRRLLNEWRATANDDSEQCGAAQSDLRRCLPRRPGRKSRGEDAGRWGQCLRS
jgi:hypothetical protein